MGLMDEIEANYPWAIMLGLGDFVYQLILDDASPAEILAKIRQTSEWKAAFPAFYAEDGSKRFPSEAEYMRTIDDLRGVLKDFGYYDAALESPMNYVGLIENGVDANELGARFETYRQLEAGSQDLRDAFYIYAGLDVKVDDLYSATVDPKALQSLTDLYDDQVARSSLSYETFMTRLSDVALRRLKNGVVKAVDMGIMSPDMIQPVINMDPNVARQWLDVLWAGQGTDELGNGYMSIADLQQSFQYAILASAASERGLALPSKERLEAFRQAGITRAQADRTYSTFAAQKAGLAGMAARAQLPSIDQSMFEQALLLSDGGALSGIRKAQNVESAAGMAQSGYGLQDEYGRIVQSGRRK